MSASTQMSWRRLVEAFDDENRHRDSLYPIAYTFSDNKVKRDSGPESGIYTK